MPEIHPIAAVSFKPGPGGEVGDLIAPPYDVLDAPAKAALLARNGHNIVAVDLPHLPAKTVGPDAVYEQAGRTYRHWLDTGVLLRRQKPALFVYQQTYTIGGVTHRRRGLIANVTLQAFGPAPGGRGGVYPHEQTFSGPKEDRLKLMRATRAQLSPIFGLFPDPGGQVTAMLSGAVDAGGAPQMLGRTGHDDVLHEVWPLDDPPQIGPLIEALSSTAVFIADGHHRYTTALNYRAGLSEGGAALPADHSANQCMFVLVSMQDPGLIVQPTHRVLGGLADLSMQRLSAAADGRLNIAPFQGGDLHALERALPAAGCHAMGLVAPADPQTPMAIMTTGQADPLGQSHADRAPAWRQLDVAVLHELLIESVCRPTFCPRTPGGRAEVVVRMAHTVDELKRELSGGDCQLGVIVQPTPLAAVRQVSEAGELMPQKSTFFYPKVATGLVIHPLD